VNAERAPVKFSAGTRSAVFGSKVPELSRRISELRRFADLLARLSWPSYFHVIPGCDGCGTYQRGFPVGRSPSAHPLAAVTLSSSTRGFSLPLSLRSRRPAPPSSSILSLSHLLPLAICLRDVVILCKIRWCESVKKHGTRHKDVHEPASIARMKKIREGGRRRADFGRVERFPPAAEVA